MAKALCNYSDMNKVESGVNLNINVCFFNSEMEIDIVSVFIPSNKTPPEWETIIKEAVVNHALNTYGITLTNIIMPSWKVITL